MTNRVYTQCFTKQMNGPPLVKRDGVIRCLCKKGRKMLMRETKCRMHCPTRVQRGVLGRTCCVTCLCLCIHHKRQPIPTVPLTTQHLFIIGVLQIPLRMTVQNVHQSPLKGLWMMSAEQHPFTQFAKALVKNLVHTNVRCVFCSRANT